MRRLGRKVSLMPSAQLVRSHSCLTSTSPGFPKVWAAALAAAVGEVSITLPHFCIFVFWSVAV